MRPPERDAAGIGVLDDDAGRLGELPHALERGVGVGDVVERELLALHAPARPAIDGAAARAGRGRTRARWCGFSP